MEAFGNSSEKAAALSQWRVAAVFDRKPGKSRAFDHGHHYTGGAQVQGHLEVVRMIVHQPDYRHYRRSLHRDQDVPQRLGSDRAVLRVDQ